MFKEIIMAENAVGLIFKKSVIVKRVKEEDLVEELIKEFESL